MVTFNFHVRDMDHDSEREDIIKTLKKLDWQLSEAESADLIAVHGASDAPDKTKGISEIVVYKCLERQGIYIDYTAAPGTAWKRIGTRSYRGTYSQLMQRLNELSKPASLTDIEQTLDKYTYPSVYVPALAILCQGYLAAHFPQPSKASGPVKKALDAMGWSEFAATEKGKELVKRVASQKDKTADPGWWKKVFENIEKGDLGRKLREEWGDEAIPNEVSELLKAIFGDGRLDDDEDAENVARAYIELAKALRDKMS